MLASLHNHTRWSDGKPTVAEMAAAAPAHGLHEVGISDHLVLHPSGADVGWTMPLDRLDEYVREVRAARVEGVAVRAGVEADYFPETIGDLRGILAEQDLDYVIGSVHYVDGFPIDSSPDDWAPLSPEEVNDVWRLYWRRVREMAASGVFDFAAHLDLPKKFGFRPSADLSAEAMAALDAIAGADMALEINTAGWSLKAGEAYPSPWLLHESLRRGIPLLINADAHRPAHLTRDFARARTLAREAGYAHLVRYERRRRIPFPLPEEHP